MRTRFFFALLLAISASAQNSAPPEENPVIVASADAPPIAPAIAAPKRNFAARAGAEVGWGFTTMVRDHALLWSSPVRSRRNLLRTALPFAAATALGLAVDHRVVSHLPNTPDQIRYSKTISVAGTYYSLGAAAGVFVAAGAVARNRHAIETGLLAAEAVAHTESISQMLKYAAGRERPDLDDRSRGRFWHREQSFPSGHAMGTWAVATVISKEYHHNRFIRYGIYGLPVIVSASRIGANRHFVSDVVGGGAIGYLIGGWLYDRHHNPALGGAPVRRRSITVTPDIQYVPRFRALSLSFQIAR